MFAACYVLFVVCSSRCRWLLLVVVCCRLLLLVVGCWLLSLFIVDCCLLFVVVSGATCVCCLLCDVCC